MCCVPTAAPRAAARRRVAPAPPLRLAARLLSSLLSSLLIAAALLSPALRGGAAWAAPQIHVRPLYEPFENFRVWSEWFREPDPFHWYMWMPVVLTNTGDEVARNVRLTSAVWDSFNDGTITTPRPGDVGGTLPFDLAPGQRAVTVVTFRGFTGRGVNFNTPPWDSLDFHKLDIVGRFDKVGPETFEAFSLARRYFPGPKWGEHQGWSTVSGGSLYLPGRVFRQVAPLSLVINPGNATPKVLGFSISGPHAADYQIVSFPYQGQTVPANTLTQFITLRFAPSAEGERVARYRVHLSNDGVFPGNGSVLFGRGLPRLQQAVPFDNLEIPYAGAGIDTVRSWWGALGEPFAVHSTRITGPDAANFRILQTGMAGGPFAAGNQRWTDVAYRAPDARTRRATLESVFESLSTDYLFRYNFVAGSAEVTARPTVTRAAGGGVSVALSVSNGGGITARNVRIQSVTLGSATASAVSPSSLGDIAPGAAKAASCAFGNLPAGASVVRVRGTYDGGSFLTSLRVSIP